MHSPVMSWNHLLLPTPRLFSIHIYTFLYSFYTNDNLYSFPKLFLFSFLDFGVHFLSVHKEIPYFYDNPVFHWMIYWDSLLKIFHTIFKGYTPFTVFAKYWLYSLCCTIHVCSLSYGESNGTPLQYSCLENPMDGGAWKAAVHGVVEGLTRLSDFTFTFHFRPLEKGMATHFSVLAWRIPGMGEPGGLQSLGSHRVGHDWSNLAAAAAAACLNTQ